MTAFERCDAVASKASAALAITGAIGLLLATTITCISILLKLLRRTLDSVLANVIDPVYWSWVRPILGEEELVQFTVGIALFSALPWVMLNKGHIRVNLFSPLFGLRMNRVLDVLADLALTGIAYLIMTRQWQLIFKKTRGEQESPVLLLFSGDTAAFVDRMRMSQESQILGMPLWPFYIIAEVCVVAFFLIGLFCMARSIRALWTSNSPDNSISFDNDNDSNTYGLKDTIDR